MALQKSLSSVSVGGRRPNADFEELKSLHIEGEARALSSNDTNEDDDDYYSSLPMTRGSLNGSQNMHDCYAEHSITNSTWCKVGMAVIIGLNVFTIGFEATLEKDSHLKTIFGMVENIFTVLYVVEISYRIYESGLIFFRQPWNLFDFLVTLAGVADSMLDIVGSSGVGVAAIRIFRVFRILRLFRTFTSIDIVLATTMAATAKLAVLFLVLLFVFAVLLTNMMEDTHDHIVDSRFGDLGRSMWTVFKLMTMQDWIETAEHVNSLRPGTLLVFALLVFLGPIAITALVPAVLIEIGTIDREQRKEKDLARHRHLGHVAKRKLLRRLFSMTDKDGNGMVSVSEMNEMLDSFDALRLLKTHNLNVEEDLRDMKLSLFQLWEERLAEIDDDEHDYDELGEDEFIKGMLQIWGDMDLRMIWRAIITTRMHVVKIHRPDVVDNVTRVMSSTRIGGRASYASSTARSSSSSRRPTGVDAGVLNSTELKMTLERMNAAGTELKTMFEKTHAAVFRGFGDIAKEMERLNSKVDHLSESLAKTETKSAALAAMVPRKSPINDQSSDNGWDALVVGLREERAIMETLHMRFDELLRQLERHHEEFKRDCRNEFSSLHEHIEIRQDNSRMDEVGETSVCKNGDRSELSLSGMSQSRTSGGVGE